MTSTICFIISTCSLLLKLTWSLHIKPMGHRMTMRAPDLVPITFSSNRPKDIYFYNTLTRQKEKFRAMNAPKVSFYRLGRYFYSISLRFTFLLHLISCGPTVYDFAHIGNFRAFLTYDLIKRWLQYCAYDVDHICNLTDVDDKIIVKMAQDQMTLQQITEKYSNAFFEDLRVRKHKLLLCIIGISMFISDRS